METCPRNRFRTVTEEEFIEVHGSGTLRKNKRIGFKYRSQYLEERTCYEYGWEFFLSPASRVTSGPPLTEGDVSAVTEAGWHIERYLTLNPFPADEIEVAYLNVDSDERVREGIGLKIKSSAPWVPTGTLVCCIIAEYDLTTRSWLKPTNPF